jgi:flagellar motor switch protein FliM
MSQVLSQDEIDALLKGISEDEVEIEPASAAAADVQVESFDFAKLTRGRKEKLPALNFVYDRFSKALSLALSLFLEREVEISFQPIQHIEYHDLIKSLPLPTNLNVVTTENLKGFFIVVFDANLIFSVLETIFGSGQITAPRTEMREFTRIEINVIRKLMDIVCSEMEKAWAPVFEIRCRYSRSEMNPNYITMVAPEEIVSLCEFSLTIEGIQSWMKVCVPYTILEPIKSYLISTPSREDREMRERWAIQMQERILDLPVELRAILGRKKIAVQEFLSLREGSILFIDRHADDPVTVMVNRQTKIAGRMGMYKGNKAVRISGFINWEDT